jgi:hypothetical protein
MSNLLAIVMLSFTAWLGTAGVGPALGQQQQGSPPAVPQSLPLKSLSIGKDKSSVPCPIPDPRCNRCDCGNEQSSQTKDEKGTK